MVRRRNTKRAAQQDGAARRFCGQVRYLLSCVMNAIDVQCLLPLVFFQLRYQYSEELVALNSGLGARRELDEPNLTGRHKMPPRKVI